MAEMVLILMTRQPQRKPVRWQVNSSKVRPELRKWPVESRKAAYPAPAKTKPTNHKQKPKGSVGITSPKLAVKSASQGELLRILQSLRLHPPPTPPISLLVNASAESMLAVLDTQSKKAHLVEQLSQMDLDVSPDSKPEARQRGAVLSARPATSRLFRWKASSDPSKERKPDALADMSPTAPETLKVMLLNTAKAALSCAAEAVPFGSLAVVMFEATQNRVQAMKENKRLLEDLDDLLNLIVVRLPEVQRAFSSPCVENRMQQKAEGLFETAFLAFRLVSELHDKELAATAGNKKAKAATAVMRFLKCHQEAEAIKELIERLNRVMQHLVFEHTFMPSAGSVREEAPCVLTECPARDAVFFWHERNHYGLHEVRIHTLVDALLQYAKQQEALPAILYDVSGGLAAAEAELVQCFDPSGKRDGVTNVNSFANFLGQKPSVCAALQPYLDRAEGKAREECREELSELHDALEPVDFDVSDKRTRFVEGTRTWAFKAIEEWVALPEDTAANSKRRRLLLVRGGPGSGKSALAAQCMSEYGKYKDADGQKMPTAPHFFFKDDEHTPRRLLATLAYGLACSQAKVRQSLYKKLPEVKKALSDLKCDLAYLFDFLILHPLLDGTVSRGPTNTAVRVQQAPLREPDVFIVIDALDEMPTNNQERQFYKILEHQIQKLPRHFRFIVTSRYIDEVTSLASNYHQMELHDDMDDIELFVRQQTIEKTSLQSSSVSPEEKDEVVRLIQECSGGLMIVAELISRKIEKENVNRLGEELTIEDVRKLIGDVKKSGDTSSGNIYNMYKETLDRVDDGIKQRAGDNQELLDVLKALKKQLLAALVVAKGDGLRREDLAQLAIEARLNMSEHVEYMSQSLALLFARSKPGEPLKLFHKTVYDFLKNEKAAGEHAISEIDGHAIMATSCLRLLSERKLLVATKSASMPSDKTVVYAAHYGHRHLTDVLRLKAKSDEGKKQWEHRAHMGGWFTKDPPKWRRYMYYAKRRTRYFVLNSDAGSVEYFKRARDSKGDPITLCKKILIEDINSEKFEEKPRLPHRGVQEEETVQVVGILRLRTAKRTYKLEPVSNVQGRIWQRALQDLRQQRMVGRKPQAAGDNDAATGSAAGPPKSFDERRAGIDASIAIKEWANKFLENRPGEDVRDDSGRGDDEPAGQADDHDDGVAVDNVAIEAIPSKKMASEACGTWLMLQLETLGRPYELASELREMEQALDAWDDATVDFAPLVRTLSRLIRAEWTPKLSDALVDKCCLGIRLESCIPFISELRDSPAIKTIEAWMSQPLRLRYSFPDSFGLTPCTLVLNHERRVCSVAWAKEKATSRFSKDKADDQQTTTASLLATGVHDDAIRLWDKDKGDCITLINVTDHIAKIKAMSLTSDGFLLVGIHKRTKLLILENNESYTGEAPLKRRELLDLEEEKAEMLGEIRHVALFSPLDQPDPAWRVAVVSSYVPPLVKCKGCSCQIEHPAPKNCLACDAKIDDDRRKLVHDHEVQKHKSDIRVFTKEKGELLRYVLPGAGIKAGDGQVTSLTFSPCGTILALLRPGCELQLLCWHEVNGHQVGKIIKTEHRFAKSDESRSGASCVAWSFDVKQDMSDIAVGMENGSLRIWKYKGKNGDMDATCRYLLSLLGHTRQVSCVAWANKDSYLASGSSDQTVRLWEVDSGACLAVFNGHSKKVLCVAWSPLQDQVVSGAMDRTARVWDVARYGAFAPLQSSHTDSIRAISVSPLYEEGKCRKQWLAAATKNGCVRVYDLTNGDCIPLPQHKAAVTSLCWQQGSPVLATVCRGSPQKFPRKREGRIRLWCGLENSELPKPRKVTVEDGELLVLSWSTRGVLACGGGESGNLILVTNADDAEEDTKPISTKTVRPPAHVQSFICSLAWRPDGDWLAVSYPSGLYVLSKNSDSFPSEALDGVGIEVLDKTDGEDVPPVPGKNLSWSATGTLLASLTASVGGATVFIYDMTRPAEPSKISQLVSTIHFQSTGLAWLPTEEVLCTADDVNGGRVVLWRRRRLESEKGKKLDVSGSIESGAVPPSSFSNSDTESMLCSPTSEVLWEAERLEGNFGSIQHLACSPDQRSRLLVTASANQILRVWERLLVAEEGSAEA